MGGDHGLDVIIPACVNAVKKHVDLRLLLVGNQKQIKTRLNQYGSDNLEQFTIVHAN